MARAKDPEDKSAQFVAPSPVDGPYTIVHMKPGDVLRRASLIINAQ